MGVPITFLHKFNPEQFEIIKFRKGNDDKDLSINGKCPYFRILIKNKRIQPKVNNEIHNKSLELTSEPIVEKSNINDITYFPDISIVAKQTVHL